MFHQRDKQFLKFRWACMAVQSIARSNSWQGSGRKQPNPCPGIWQHFCIAPYCHTNLWKCWGIEYNQCQKSYARRQIQSPLCWELCHGYRSRGPILALHKWDNNISIIHFAENKTRTWTKKLGYPRIAVPFLIPTSFRNLDWSLELKFLQCHCDILHFQFRSGSGSPDLQKCQVLLRWNKDSPKPNPSHWIASRQTTQTR